MAVLIEIDDSEVRGALGRLQRNAENPAPALHAIGAYGVFSTQRRFEQERDPEGKPWQPLSPRTANKRLRRGRRGYQHILRVSGRLVQSINYDVSPGAVEWGSNVVYAGVHQLGGTIDMPAREQRLTIKRTRRKGGGFISRFARAAARGNVSERVVKIGGHQVTIPARPFLGINEADRSEISEIVADHLRGESK